MITTIVNGDNNVVAQRNIKINGYPYQTIDFEAEATKEIIHAIDRCVVPEKSLKNILIFTFFIYIEKVIFYKLQDKKIFPILLRKYFKFCDKLRIKYIIKWKENF